MTYDNWNALKKTVETPYGKFAYVDVGEGPAVLFIHGLFMSGFMWHHVIDAVKPDRRCVAYNLPAHGGSEVAQNQDLGLQAQADMLEAFCDALDLAAVDIVANDTGGAVAQAFTVRDSSRVRTLTLTNCEARDWMPSKNELGQLVKNLAESGDLAPALVATCADRDAAREGVLAQTVETIQSMSDEELRGIMEPHQATHEAAQQVERFAASLTPEQLDALTPELRKLEVRTIAVWGTADEVFPLELAHWLRDTIPGCKEVVEIEGGLLFWPWERSDELVPHLRRHWNTVLEKTS